MKIFSDYLKVILINEGGAKYTDVIGDPGRGTKYGVSDAADGKIDGLIDIDRDGIGDIKVQDLTLEQATEVYQKFYWNLLHIDKITNEDLKLHIFDMGVNAGYKTAIKLLQYALKIPTDGVCGNKTITATNNYKNNIINDYKKERIKYYYNLTIINPVLKKFLQGWLNRVDHLKFI